MVPGNIKLPLYQIDVPGCMKLSGFCKLSTLCNIDVTSLKGPYIGIHVLHTSVDGVLKDPPPVYIQLSKSQGHIPRGKPVFNICR